MRNVMHKMRNRRKKVISREAGGKIDVRIMGFGVWLLGYRIKCFVLLRKEAVEIFAQDFVYAL